MIDLNKNNFNKLNHIIYYEWFLDIRGGGPTGYLANLLDGLNCLDNNQNPLIFFNNTLKPASQIAPQLSGIHRIAHKFFYQNDYMRSFYINHISRYEKNNHSNYVAFLNNLDSMHCDPQLFSKINLTETKTIHVHTVGDAIKVKNNLAKMHAEDIKLMLTCHTPEAPSSEYYKSYIEQGYSKVRAEEIRNGWNALEKKAFECSDILVFPSFEAMEPLKSTLDNFENIIKNKDIRFIASGAKKLHSTLTKDEAKKKYGVQGKFVVGYVGRHNEVKGYDILQQAANLTLPQNNNICFLIGGSQGKVFSPLSSDRWIEAGWVNPADLFAAIDVFVLPNRMTYYDLVLLEVMSMGVPIIASSTGGNKSVQNMTGVLTLYDNSAKDLAKKIIDFSKYTPEEIAARSCSIKQAYEHYFTPVHFAGRYINLINQIYDDYHFYE